MVWVDGQVLALIEHLPRVVGLGWRRGVVTCSRVGREGTGSGSIHYGRS